MDSLYSLPREKVLGQQVFSLCTDFRQVLQILSVLDDPDLPEYVRWLTALNLFYEPEVPAQHRREAMEYLAAFLSAGEQSGQPGPKLIDWQQDADAIISGVNKVAGREVRAMEYVHWWTFLSWFHGIEGGALATLVSVRDKLARGKALSDWEKDFYRQNKAKVDLKKRYCARELEEQQRLKAMLGMEN
jgi:hypothetical protein